MINIVEHKNIDKQKWDACIKASVNECAFPYSWYLDAVCDKWDALILSDYDAVFPLAKGLKLSINYLYQPLFTRYFGVFSKKEITEQLVNDFFDAIPSKYKYIEFSIHEKNRFKRTDFKLKERLFQTLNLNQNYSHLFESFKGDAKRNIKKAEKNNLVVTNNILPKDVVELFKNNKGRELTGIREQDYNVLGNLMNAALKNNLGILVGVLNSEKMLIAAGFFIKSNDTILFLKGSANSEGKSTGAMYLVLNYIFKTYAISFNLFDFGGSSVESVASFNRNFGAKDCVYLQVKKNRLPFVLKLMTGKK